MTIYDTALASEGRALCSRLTRKLGASWITLMALEAASFVPGYHSSRAERTVRNHRMPGSHKTPYVRQGLARRSKSSCTQTHLFHVSGTRLAVQLFSQHSRETIESGKSVVSLASASVTVFEASSNSRIFL